MLFVIIPSSSTCNSMGLGSLACKKEEYSLACVNLNPDCIETYKLCGLDKLAPYYENIEDLD